MTVNVLVTGADGQVGKALQATAPESVSVTALDVGKLDITDIDAVVTLCATHSPDYIINAAAYTAVDRAETDIDAAYAVNRDGPRHLAQAAKASGAKLIHLSTDFIFDGARSTPYDPEAAARPLGVYGASKLAGEQAVISASDTWLILRTAWVYAADGHNFVRTMLRLMQEGKALRVVADQIGSPTWATGLAQAIWQAVAKGMTGMHHWTDAGVASWYDFAVAIQEEATALGLITKPVSISPVRTLDYPTPAQRPAYSVLDKTATWEALGFTAPHWRENLRLMLGEVAANEAH